MTNPPQRPSFRFERTRRVRRKRDYNVILEANRSRSDAWLIVYLAERAEVEGVGEEAGAALPCRLGLIVGRKVGNAPRRNRAKRLIREAFRLLQHELPAGLDIVVMPRTEVAAELTLAKVQQSLLRLARRPLPPQRERKRSKKRGRRR